MNDWHTETEIAVYLELAGHRVDRYQHDFLDIDKFVNRASRYDIVITSLPQNFPPDFWRQVREAGPKIIAWYFDWIAAYQGREQQYLKRLVDFDLVLSTDGYDPGIYRGVNRFWLPHACDPRVYLPYEEKPRYDVGFIGHVYTPYRSNLIRGLRAKYRFHIAGENNEVWGPNYRRACAQVRVMVGDNHRNDIAGYWSDRVYLSLACGAFLLYPRVEGLERHFTDGKHLVFYDSEQDLHEKIDHYLPLEDERKRIALDGSAHTRLNHSWEVRVREFEAICDSVW